MPKYPFLRPLLRGPASSPLKKRALVIALSLAICCGIAAGRFYYRDRVPFFPPVSYEGDVPVRDDDYGSGLFGARRSGGRRHKGLDIEAPAGAPVMAAMSGRVKVAYNENGFGNYVIVRHGKGRSTLYAHLDKVCVKDRSRVRQGDILGSVGNTGNARYEGIKYHLHLEVREGDVRVDPMPYLTQKRP